jgi:hypothetical protein
MNHENDFVNFFYNKYEGRVAIGVGYDQNLTEVFPFVFEDRDGKSIGVVALGAFTDEIIDYVHIYHIGAFKGNLGFGSQILQELCLQADKQQITLSLSPIPISTGSGESMSTEQLTSWYRQFGFNGSTPFKREPR